MASSNKKTKLAKQQAATKARREQRSGATGGSASGRAASTNASVASRPTKAEQKKKSRDTLVKVAAVVFAAIMAFSMMLPSCSAIFANNTAQQAADNTTQTDASTDASTDATTDSTADGDTSGELTGIALVDSQYQPLVTELEAKLEADENDLASILNLGYYYMEWATNASSYATVDDDVLYVSDLYDKAVSYFDRYLEMNDSNEVRTRRALCMFYAGDTYEAISALEEFTATTADYAPAWVYLGMMYESSARTSEAEQAYLKATAVDPDDAYGLRSWVTERIASINGSSDSSTTTDSSASAGTSLQDALSSGSGTSY